MEKRKKIYKVVVRSLINVTKIKRQMISEDCNICTDLALDSLDLAELIIDIEENLNISLPFFNHIETIKELVDIVEKEVDDDNVIFKECSGQCCCNCNNRWEAYTKDSATESIGWACVLKADKRVFINWFEHSMCERWKPKE